MKPVPDVRAAVACFLANFKKIRHLPFVADNEVEVLFGSQVAETLTELDEYNRLQEICLRCSSRCCQRIKCELYDARFSACPVVNWRPALCRMHYCEAFNPIFAIQVKILGDIYLESLIAAAGIDPDTAGGFDCPTFSPLVPDFISEISPVLANLRDGKTPVEEAIRQISGWIETGTKSRLLPRFPG
ncbi:MAG TPA: hypothetical protein VLH15_01200 [Dehalococcoidales bacterium]|nr:hypothetical protein [Dehalococcoidales bacterium]